jgi:hypothetical protein
MDKANFIMNEIYKILKDILTGKDNETYDNGRIICLLSFIIYFCMALGSIIVDEPWQPMDFASGIGAMAVGFGVNLHLKRYTEPNDKNEKD